MTDYPAAGIKEEDTYTEAINKIAQLPDTDIKTLMANYPSAGINETDTYTEAINKIAQLPENVNWEIRTIGDNLYRINPNTGARELLVSGDVTEEGGFDLSNYFSPSELREIRISGIDPNTKKGFEAAQEMFPPERDRWNSADAYIDENIKQGATSTSDMAEIFSNLTRPAPDGAGLGSTDARTLMAEYSMMYNSTLGWIYLP